MKKIKILLLLYIMLLPFWTAAQCTSNQVKPQWIDGYFQEENNSYIEAISATGSSETEARNRAAALIVERRNLAAGTRVEVQIKNGDFVVNGNKELTVKARVIDEYREVCNGEYRVHLLVQTAKKPTDDCVFERVSVTDKHPVSWRVFVPGMAQIHKGSKTKGGLIIAGEAVFIGGIVVAESMRASYLSKMNTTHHAATRLDYHNKAGYCATARNVMIGGVVAFYVYNVIDGMVAKGKKQVLIGETRLQLSPFISPDANGVYLSLKF